MGAGELASRRTAKARGKTKTNYQPPCPAILLPNHYQASMHAPVDELEELGLGRGGVPDQAHVHVAAQLHALENGWVGGWVLVGLLGCQLMGEGGGGASKACAQPHNK